MTIRKFQPTNIKGNSFNNMTLGEMLDNGFELGDKYKENIIGLEKDAITFFIPKIESIVFENTFMYYPSMLNIGNWRRAFCAELVKAINSQTPVLESLYHEEIMQNGENGEKGVFNLNDGGSNGTRKAEFNTDYPQSMLDGNESDYGSNGRSSSEKNTTNKTTLDALKEFDNSNFTYQDAITKISNKVEKSGIFSIYIY